jgi:hypothetical protein
MATTETSYGARLKRGQDVLVYLSGLSVYAPPRDQESITAFSELLTSLSASNDLVTEKAELYSIAVNNRQEAYKIGNNALKKTADKVLLSIAAQYGKNSKYYKEINSIVAKIKGTRIGAVPKPTVEGELVKKISVSQQSFGSLAQFFRDMVVTLQQIPEYGSNNPTLSIEALQIQAQLHIDLNNQVTQITQALENARSQRTAQYADFHDRKNRMQAYIFAEYGRTSKEAKFFTGI